MMKDNKGWPAWSDLDGNGKATRWYKVKEALGDRLDPALSPHAYRHEAISRLFENSSLTDTEIMLLTGHRDYKSLKVYVHLKALKLKKQLQEMHDAQATAVQEAWLAEQVALQTGQQSTAPPTLTTSQALARAIAGVRSHWK